MSRSDSPSFHLRLPSELKEQLQTARGKNSLNTEIVERLERTFESDPASRLAKKLQPLIAMFDPQDREELIDLVADAVELLARSKKRRP